MARRTKKNGATAPGESALRPSPTIPLSEAKPYPSAHRGPEYAYGVPPGPLPTVLYCPECRTQHIDLGEWATRPHKKHLCSECGFEWQPALIPTVGVKSIF